MEDLSFKSLAVTGMLIGGAFWALGRSQALDNAERAPSAASQVKRQFKSEGQYRPSIHEFNQDRPAEEQNVRVDDATAQTETLGTNPTPAAQQSAADFAQTRTEISKSLAHGEIDVALDIAERKLEEVVGTPNSDMAYIGYLHEFVMQNAENAETELDVTISALKNSQDPNVKKFIYERFNTYAPELLDRLDSELDAAAITID